MLRKTLKSAFSLYHRLRRYPLESSIRFLEESQWWSREKIEEFQNEKLRDLIIHAYNNVPYYRQIMDEYGLKPSNIQSISDLSKLPILTKKIIRKNYSHLKAKNINLFRISEHSSGGSTGDPIRIVADSNSDAWGMACYYRGMSWGGYRDGDRIVKLSLGSLGLKPKTFSDRLRAFVYGELAIPAEGLSIHQTQNYHMQILKSGANYLRGYPSVICLLIQYFEKTATDHIKLKAVYPTAEMLYDFQREQIQKFFSCPVFDCYGSSEVLGLGYECEKNRGYHIPQEHVVIESVQGDATNPVFYAPGRFLITDLDNYAMPMIRYENGDSGVLSSEECTCGRGLKLISKLYGRVQDFLIAENGNLIPGNFFPHLFRFTKGIDEFQIVQESRMFLRLLIVNNKFFDNHERQMVVGTIKRYFGSGMRTEIEPVKEIPKTKAGKKRLTICKIADQYGINERINLARINE